MGFVGTGAAASSTAWPEAGASIRTKVEPPRLSKAVGAGSPQGAGPRQPWLLCLVLPSLNRTLSAPPGRRRGPGPSPSQANPPPPPGTAAPGSESRRRLLELQAPCALRLRHARPRTWALGGSLRVLRSQIRQNHNLISPGQCLNLKSSERYKAHVPLKANTNPNQHHSKGTIEPNEHARWRIKLQRWSGPKGWLGTRVLLNSAAQPSTP